MVFLPHEPRPPDILFGVIQSIEENVIIILNIEKMESLEVGTGVLASGFQMASEVSFHERRKISPVEESLVGMVKMGRDVPFDVGPMARLMKTGKDVPFDVGPNPSPSFFDGFNRYKIR